MSGTITTPASITVTQEEVGPIVTITQAGGVMLPPGVPVNPLAAEPGQNWDLQLVNGVLTWVQFTAPPGQAAWALEDGAGAIQLEDSAGYLLLEP